MNRFFRYSIAALASGALLLGLAACGGGDGEGGAGDETVFGSGRGSGVQSIEGDVVKIVTGLGAVVEAKKVSDPSLYFVKATGGGGLYSAEAELLIQDHMTRAKSLIEDPSIIELVIASNKEAKLSFAAIQEQEAAWTEAGGDNDFVNGILANETSVKLKEYQAVNPGVSEVILTNKRGFILGATNFTVKFEQRRYRWWNRGFLEGRGQDFRDDIQVDDGLGIEGVPIHLAVLDPEKVRGAGDTLSAAGLTFRNRPLDQAVGVLKVFVSLDWMKEQLGVAEPASTPATP